MADSSPARPLWDAYFMDITLQVARRSTCERARVGALIVKDKRILTTGYNGAPAGLPHCDESGHLMIGGHCVRTLHAEQNAIIQAALHGVSVAGGTMYVTHQPCLTCAKMIINAGIRKVIYAGHYPDENAVAFLSQAGVELERYPFPADETTPADQTDVISLE
ncbi:MAG: cytidine/deoxycytidylate deaminase family protein [Chloroflexi bacterium]|nr:cytidine/deoxycytidylate deaminase family protein [Chloroflexota bacterium]